MLGPAPHSGRLGPTLKPASVPFPGHSVLPQILKWPRANSMRVREPPTCTVLGGTLYHLLTGQSPDDVGDALVSLEGLASPERSHRPGRSRGSFLGYSTLICRKSDGAPSRGSVAERQGPERRHRQMARGRTGPCKATTLGMSVLIAGLRRNWLRLVTARSFLCRLSGD